MQPKLPEIDAIVDGFCDIFNCRRNNNEFNKYIDWNCNVFDWNKVDRLADEFNVMLQLDKKLNVTASRFCWKQMR